MKKENILFFRLINNDWFWSVFISLVGNRYVIQKIKEINKKKKIPKTENIVFDEFIDFYIFLSKDDRDVKEIKLDLFKQVSDEDFENMIEKISNKKYKNE